MTKAEKVKLRRQRMRAQPSGWKPSYAWVWMAGKSYRLTLKGDKVVGVAVYYTRKDGAECLRDLNINGQTAVDVLAYRRLLLGLSLKRKRKKKNDR